MEQALDNNLYLKLQNESIKQRVARFGNKLYLEFGGKLFDVEFIITVCADDIQDGKIRSDTGLSYEDETLRLIDEITNVGLTICAVVITKYTHQPAVNVFRRLLKSFKIPTYIHQPIKGYPHDIDYVLSNEGFGQNEYVKTSRPIVVVTYSFWT